MNQMTIIGNLTRDPELRTVRSSAGDVSVCNMTVAVNRRRHREGEREADFVRVVCWRTQADSCARYLRKGSKVGVTGSAKAGHFTRNDGSVDSYIEIEANDVEFLNSRAQGESAEAAAAPVPAEPSGYTQVNDEDVPF